jgi:hypothetical protein
VPIAPTTAEMPPLRRAGFEVTAWDGSRWQLVGVFGSTEEAKAEAKAVLPRRHAVRVSEEQFSEQDGTFKTRIIFSEQREGGVPPPGTAKPRRKPEVRLGSRRAEAAESGQATLALYLGGAALAVSLLSLVVTLAR